MLVMLFVCATDSSCPKSSVWYWAASLLTQQVWTIDGDSHWKFCSTSPLTASLPAAQVSSCYCTVPSAETWLTDLSDEGAQASSPVDFQPRVVSDSFIDQRSGLGEGMPIGTLRVDDARHCCAQLLTIILGAQLPSLSSMTKLHIK